jgi:hypothetical protein
MYVFETPGPVLLRVSLGAGLLSVEAAEVGRTEVELTALRDDAVTREALAEARVELTEEGGRPIVWIEAPRRKAGWRGIGRGPSIGARVRCPAGSDLDASTSHADVRADGSLGRVEVKTASGDVIVERAERTFDVVTASGDVAVSELGGSGSIKTASGDARVSLARGSLSINLVSGDAAVGEALASVGVNTVSGDVRLDAVSGGEVRVQSVSGDVRIGVRPDLRVWIDASSVSGSMRSELEPAEAPAPGEGEPVALRARTVSGDVEITRAERAAAPPGASR